MKKESNPHSPTSEREQDTQVNNSKESVLGKLYMHGYMNVDAEPMTFVEVRKLAKQVEIPDFDVMELDKYKRLAKKYKESANCIIWISFGDGGSLGYYVSCFREPDGTLNYQDSFGKLKDFPLTGTNGVFHVNKVKYQSIFANNRGYLELLHLYTHDAVDPTIQRV